MADHGVRPSPKILFIDAPDDERMRASLVSLAGTSEFISAVELPLYRQRDWDVVVSWAWSLEFDLGLHVITFGADEVGNLRQTGAWEVPLEGVGDTYAREFHSPEDLDPRIKDLINRDLAKLVLSQPKNKIYGYLRSTSFSAGARPPKGIADYVSGFLLDGDDKVVAFAYDRPLGGGKWWVLPKGLSDPVAWVRTALDMWAASDRRFVRQTEDWRQLPRWRTAEQARLDEVESRESAEWSKALSARDLRVAELQALHEGAQADADSNSLRLLTAQGDELVAAVQASLEALGFSVTDVDEEISHPGDRREDLRIAEDPKTDWLVLAEVRGYGRGAQLGDLLRLSRFRKRYLQESGREASGSWYIVNHFREQSPEGRDIPLQSNPNEVAEFALDGGLVIDTRDLFLLTRRVEDGDMSAADARAMLRDGRGTLYLK